MPRSESKIRVGIVGLGLAATPHAKGYAAHPDAEITAVCDLDGARARQFADRFGALSVYSSFEEMLHAPAMNVVDIATPTHLHARMARQAAEAGKHVHCEKPFCRSVAEGEAACKAAEENGLTLAVGETYVFLSSHQKARELIEAGEIGQPLQVRQRHGGWLARNPPAIPTGPADRRWRIDPERSGGGRFPWIFDHAVHFFAAAEYFLLDDPVSEVYALEAGQYRPAERAGAAHDPYTSAEPDIPMIVWKHRSGRAQSVWTRAERLNGRYDYMRGFSTTIVGERGMIEVLGEGGGGLTFNGKPWHLVLHRDAKETLTFRFEEGDDDVWQSDVCYYSQGHVNQIRSFVDSILSGSPPRYRGEDGARAVRCALATILSARERLPVKVTAVPKELSAAALGDHGGGG